MKERDRFVSDDITWCMAECMTDCPRKPKYIRDKTIPHSFADFSSKCGEWIVYEGGWKDFDYYPPKCKCNQCGYEEELYILNAKPTNFCPNCGADMRKGADDEHRG